MTSDPERWPYSSADSLFLQAQFDTLFRYIPIPMYLWKQAGEKFNPQLIDCNNAAAELTKNTAQEFIGKTMVELLTENLEVQDGLRECLLAKRHIVMRAPFLLHSQDDHRAVDLAFIFILPDMAAIAAISNPTTRRSES